jgi:hypothetical protein
MKTIRLGDRVESFLEAHVKGKVVQFINEGKGDWMVGSTSSPVIYCIVELDSGDTIKYKLSDLRYSYDI